MATYDGHVIPGQSTTAWINPSTGEEGEYGNYSVHTTIQPLADMPTEGSHVPGTGRHPHNAYLSEIMRGIPHQAPLAYQGFVHGGQDAPYLWDRYRTTFRGVPASEVFPTRSLNWGHDGTRVTSTSHYSGYTAGDHAHDGVPSARIFLKTGHAPGVYDYSRGGPSEPLNFSIKGVGIAAKPLDDAGVKIEDKPEGLDHAFQRTREWHGVPSARAL